MRFADSKIITIFAAHFNNAVNPSGLWIETKKFWGALLLPIFISYDVK